MYRSSGYVYEVYFAVYNTLATFTSPRCLQMPLFYHCSAITPWKHIATIMDRTNKLEQLLYLIRRSWPQAETRTEALTLFSLAITIISRRPEIGRVFCSAFSWVDNFLGG